MNQIYLLETTRLLLRPWQHDDYDKFAKMNADPEVMRYFPSLLSRDQSDALSSRLDKLVAKKGWGFWITERKNDKAFLGLVGLNYADDLPVTKCVEVGWRLAKNCWGFGYATEAAAASLHFGFSRLEQESVSAFTAVGNLPSRQVMDRIGMENRHNNFLHPRVPASSGLKEHVHYSIRREKFYNEFKEDTVTISSQSSSPE